MRTIADPRVLDALVCRLGRLTPVTPRRWGTLTAPEMLCHLGDAMAMVLGDRPRGTAVVPMPAAPLLRVLFLWSPVRWPHGVPTNARHDPRRDGSRPAAFDADAARVVEGLRRLAAATSGLEPVHGIFGPMTIRDWQRWALKHTDHHLRQFGL